MATPVSHAGFCLGGMRVLCVVCALILLAGADAFLPQTAYAVRGDLVNQVDSARVAGFADALGDLGIRRDAAASLKKRAEARYIRDMRKKHAAAAERWERTQEWKARFPAGDYTDVLLIGDSLLDELRGAVAEALPGAEVNADSGRTLEEGGVLREGGDPQCGVLDQVRLDGGLHERYVIETGNNEVGGMSLEAAEEIVMCLGADKEIYFVTELVTGNAAGTAATNASIDAVVAAYSQVHRIDWYGFAVNRTNELLRDYCHQTEVGKAAYIDVLKAGLDVCYAREG